MSASLKDGDLITSVRGTPVTDFEELRKHIMASANTPIEIGLLRDDKPLTVTVTPIVKDGRAIIGVEQAMKQVPVSAKEAAVESLIVPAKVVEQLVVTLGRYITLKDKPQLSGPVGIVKEASRAAAQSLAAYLFFFGVLSAYLAGFNLLPFPALDGGRLAFLAYEAVTRQRPNAQVEAKVHFLGLLMLLALIAVVTVFDFASIRGN